MERNGLLIGEVAARRGLSRKALRLYEARGILPTPRRTPSGYRTYPVDVLGVLHFVTQARRLGLTLREIGSIVALRCAKPGPCVHVRPFWSERSPSWTTGGVSSGAFSIPERPRVSAGALFASTSRGKEVIRHGKVFVLPSLTPVSRDRHER